MQVKIDTREKFHAITINESFLSANMTEEIDKCLLPLLKSEVKNIVLNLKDIKDIDNAAAEYLVNCQQMFYKNNASFVFCELDKEVEQKLDTSNLLEVMNITPTETEASDIVYMEEIEREFK